MDKASKDNKVVDVKGEDVPKQEIPQRPYISPENVFLRKGYTIVSISPKKASTSRIDPNTGKPVPERMYTCDYAMKVIKSDTYDQGTEVFIKADSQITPVTVLDGMIIYGAVSNSDIIATIKHKDSE